MDLQTAQQITRNTVYPIPITPSVISRVNDLGKQQNFSKLYFKNREGYFFQDVDWIEGVD